MDLTGLSVRLSGELQACAAIHKERDLRSSNVFP